MTKKQKNKFITYIVIFIAAVIYLSAERIERSNLSSKTDENTTYGYVHFLDVGQGDCTLIESQNGNFSLIDASTDDAKHKIVSYLENEGVTELEYVIFTHPHEDHIGCGDEVLKSFTVKNIIMTDKTETTACYSELIDEIVYSKKINGTKVIKPGNGDTFYMDGIEFLIISDGKDYFDNTNNSSICFKLELGKSTFLFTGDAEKVVEYDLLESGYRLDAEVYKCAHHGSSTSNSEAFIDAVNPDISVISCGLDNDYGHPHREIVAALSERGIVSKRTDLNGDVVIAFNENEIILP
ncbi:MAG: MBL fold metallo-hydrolase [Clostridia bacterium]|nr:MBL fold metallo-hydrolase [Clostridia bacterium]